MIPSPLKIAGACFPMNVRLHRKQIIMLILALLLAAASFLIPLPQRPEHQAPSANVEQPKYAILVHAFSFETA